MITPAFFQELQDRSKGIKLEDLGDFLNENMPEFQERMYNSRVGISFRDLNKRGRKFSIGGDNVGWAASTIKIPVMIETLRAIDKGKLRLEDKIAIDHRYTLENGDLISALPQGKKINVGTLLYFMITKSDNEATNMLINTVGLENINRTMQKLGAKRTMLGHMLAYNVPRKTTDWNLDGSNLTTPQDMSQLLYSIYKNKAASSFGCNIMKFLLEKESAKPLGIYLPNGTIVGNKIGSIFDPDDGGDFHDVGVINRDYILSIMCNKIKFHLRQVNLSSLENLLEPSEFGFLGDDCSDSTKSSSIFPDEFIGSLSKLVYNLYYGESK